VTVTILEGGVAAGRAPKRYFSDPNRVHGAAPDAGAGRSAEAALTLESRRPR